MTGVQTCALPILCLSAPGWSFGILGDQVRPGELEMAPHLRERHRDKETERGREGEREREREREREGEGGETMAGRRMHAVGDDTTVTGSTEMSCIIRVDIYR